MIFETFDTDGNGTMSLNEFLVYMGLSSGGSLEQKLQGSFMLFDKDHNGELERDEVINCFLTLLYSSLYKREMEANHGAKPKGITISEKQKMEITTVVNEIFSSIDTDGVCLFIHPTFLFSFSRFIIYRMAQLTLKSLCGASVLILNCANQ